VVPKKKAAEPVAADDLVARIGRVQPLVGVILEEALAVEVRGNTLLIRLAAGADALKRRLEERECRELLGREAAAPGAPPLALSVTLDGAAPAAAAAAARPVTASLLERIRSEPGVGQLLDAFGAQVVDVRALDAASSDPDEEKR
jgi:hypothetical protein